MGEELYDVILKVPSNGIHSPWNLHAFRPHTLILPTTCSMCQEMIYPFGHGACCVRCHCYVHRSCTRKDDVICDHFLLGPGRGKSSKNWGVSGSLVENPRPSSSRSRRSSSSTREVIQVAPSVVSTGHRLLEKMNISADGKDIPVPGSEHCIWRGALRELATDYKISRMASLPSHRHALQKLTVSLLKDSSSFPGRVATELRDLFIAITFPLDKDYLLHAKEVLGNIACAVLALLPESVSTDEEQLQAVITTVDWAILKRNDGSMYDRVWSAAQRIGSRMDNALVARLMEQQEMYSSKEMETIPHYVDIEAKLCRMPCEYAMMDKCKRLVQALKYVASSTSVSGNTLVSSAQGHTSSDGRPAQDLNIDAETIMEQSIQDMNVDADALMQRFCDVVAHHTLKYEIYWHAESIYIEFMCRSDNWLLGAEGYALVTLQQALRAICPTAALSSAAQNEVVVSKDENGTESIHDQDDDTHSEHSSNAISSSQHSTTSSSQQHHSAVYPVTASE